MTPNQTNIRGGNSIPMYLDFGQVFSSTKEEEGESDYRNDA